MIEPTKGSEPTVSNDPNLYDYTNEDAPADVVINVGTSPLMVIAPHAVNDPNRMEVGDRRRGAYYLTCIGKPVMTGLMLLQKVDVKRLAQVNKIRDIRVGNREPDWVVEARKRSEDKGEDVPAPYVNPHDQLTPLQRAAKGVV